jgi:hypothetical protein
MPVRHWLESIRKECARQGLPPSYVERLVSELSDHVTEFNEGSNSMEANERQPSVLGSASEIAAVATSEYRRRRFSGRHPWLAFVIAPTLALPLLWATSLCLFVLAAQAMGFDSDNPTVSAENTRWVNEMLPIAVMTSLVLPVIAATIAFCRLAIKSAVSRRWMLLCCAILAVLGGAANSSVSLPSEGAKGSVAFGFGFSLPPSPQQFAQFILPLLIAFCVIRFHGHSLYPTRKAL